jgi:hypothetical protein
MAESGVAYVEASQEKVAFVKSLAVIYQVGFHHDASAAFMRSAEPHGLPDRLVDTLERSVCRSAFS